MAGSSDSPPLLSRRPGPSRSPLTAAGWRSPAAACAGRGRTPRWPCSHSPRRPPPPPAAPATTGAVRRTHNLVLEDRLWWAGERLFASGMGEGKDGRYTATEPRLYRVDTGPADDLRLLRVAPSLAGSVGEMVPLADGSLLTVTAVSTRMRISLVDAASGAVRTLRDQRGWIANLSAARSGERIAFAAADAHRCAEI